MIIFLSGPDTFRSRKKLKEFQSKYLKEVDASGLNMSVVDGSKLDINSLRTHLLSTPFLVKKRMVIIEGLLSANPKKDLQVTLQEILQSDSSKDTIIILWEGQMSFTVVKSALYKYLKKQKYSYHFELLKGEELPQWYKKILSEKKISIHQQALILFMSKIGNDLWTAHNEIEKLAAYSRGRQITVEDVKTLCSDTLEENIFSLTDALGNRDKKSALSLVQKQLHRGTKETELLGKFVWHFKNILLVKSLKEDAGRINSFELSQKLSLHPYVAKKALAQSRNFSISELKTFYGKLLEIEYKIKTGKGDGEILLELLIAGY